MCRINIVRLGEHTFNNSKDCEVGIEPNQTICSDPAVNVKIHSVIYHPDFKENQSHYMNDIALIRLNHTVNFTGKSFFETARILSIVIFVIILLEPTNQPTILSF